MKSEKAKEYLLECVKVVGFLYPGAAGECDLKLKEAKRAVELAEQEAEERVRAELTRWRNPRKELPEEGVPVLVKFQNGAYAVLLRYNHPSLGQGWTPDNVGILTDDSQIIGWRPILE